MAATAAPLNRHHPLVGVGFVGKNNKPLLVLPLGPEDRSADLELNLTIHSCLDVVEERQEAGGVNAVPYLGFLSLMGNHATYASLGSTRIKVFVVLDSDFEPTPRDEDMQALLGALHAAYIDWMSNPFVELSADVGEPVPSETSVGGKRLLARLRRICESNNLAGGGGGR